MYSLVNGGHEETQTFAFLFLSLQFILHQCIYEHMEKLHSALFIRPYGHGSFTAQGKGKENVCMRVYILNV